MARVRARQPDLDTVRAVLIVISAEPAEEIAPVARKEGWTGPVLADQGRVVYRAFGLGRLPWHRVFTLRTLAMYIGFLLRGKFPQPSGQDARQQGGDFIVDGNGTVRLPYAGQSPDDRPPVGALIRCLRSLADGRAKAS